MGADDSVARSSSTGQGTHGQESGLVKTKDAYTSEARKLCPKMISERTMNEQKVYMDGTVAIWTKFENIDDYHDVSQKPIIYSLHEDYKKLRQDLADRGGFKKVQEVQEANDSLSFTLYTRQPDFRCTVDESNLASVLRLAKGAAPGDVFMCYKGEKKGKKKGH